METLDLELSHKFIQKLSIERNIRNSNFLIVKQIFKRIYFRKANFILMNVSILHQIKGLEYFAWVEIGNPFRKFESDIL